MRDLNPIICDSAQILAYLLGTVVLIQEVMCDLLEVRQMCRQKGAPQASKVRVCWVIHTNVTPRVAPGAHWLPINDNLFLRSNNSKGHKSAQLGVVLDGVLVILFDVIGEIVDWDAVVLNVLHDTLLETSAFALGHAICLSDDWDDVDSRAQSSHELNVDFTEGMSSRSDEVEEGVDTVVPETRVTLDTRFLCENVVVLSLEKAEDLLECWFVVKVVAKSWDVDQSDAQSHTILIKLDVDWPDPDTFLDVSRLWVVANLVSDDL